MESISFVSFSPLHFVMTGWSEGGGGGAGRWLGKVFLFSPGDGSFHRMSGDMGVGPGCGGGGDCSRNTKSGEESPNTQIYARRGVEMVSRDFKWNGDED